MSMVSGITHGVILSSNIMYAIMYAIMYVSMYYLCYYVLCMLLCMLGIKGSSTGALCLQRKTNDIYEGASNAE